MGFGTELLFIVALGLVVLGPKRLHIVLGHVARAKAELEKTSRGIKSPLAAELDGVPRSPKYDDEPLLPPAGDLDERDSLATRTS